MSGTTGASQPISPFHVGEQQVQSRLGVRDIEAWARKVVRNHLPDQHRQFHTSLPFLIVTARDHKGRPWATLLHGVDGFITSPDAKHLEIAARPTPGDALEDAFAIGADIGILGIELVTRRRNRLNGRIAGSSGQSIRIAVDQSFGNCPQYIRERQWRRCDQNRSGEPVVSAQLSPAQRRWIETADTFFIASGYRGEGEDPSFGLDVSHRGGERGFVEVLDDGHLRFPDYAGNNHYNTIGNLVLDPRAGFLFIDFATGSLLQLTGQASIDWDFAELNQIPGARRLVTLKIEKIVELPGATALRWQMDAQSVRSLRLVEKIAESSDVTSFLFEARDGGALPGFAPGQHLPIELNVPGVNNVVRRTYSLSGSPHDNRYRITVKRVIEGLASNHLHDELEPGAIIEGRRPAGDFTLSCTSCPLVLISAGVGLTPLVSMLHAVAATRNKSPVWFIHGARDGTQHPLAAELRALAAECPNVTLHVAFSQPGPNDVLGRQYDSLGRVTPELVTKLVTNANALYYVCGPAKFMAQIQDGLEAGGTSADRIFTETFGPSS